MRRWIVLAAVLVVLVAGAYLAISFYGVKILNAQLQKVAGPGLTVAGIEVRPTRLSMRGVTYEDPSSKRKLIQVTEMRIYPALLSTLKGTLEIRRLTLLKPTLFFYRSQGGEWIGPGAPRPKTRGEGEGGENRGKESETGSFRITIGHLRIQDGLVDVEDRKMGGDGARLQLKELYLDLRGLNYPLRSARCPLEMKGKMGGRHTGTLGAKGWIDPKTGDMETSFDAGDVDLKAFEPYYRKRVSAEIESGDLALHATIAVKGKMIDAPGELELKDLRVKEEGTVLWIPAKTLVSLLRDRGGRIKVQFHVKGNLDDPRFNLQETFLTRVALSLAEGLGVPIKVVAEEFFGGSLKGAKGLLEGLRSLDDLFKKRKEKGQ